MMFNLICGKKMIKFWTPDIIWADKSAPNQPNQNKRNFLYLYLKKEYLCLTFLI